MFITLEALPTQSIKKNKMGKKVERICKCCNKTFMGYGNAKWCEKKECQEHKKNWQKKKLSDDQGPDHPLIRPVKYPPHQCSCGCGRITTNRFLSDDCMMVRSWGPSMEDGEMYF